MKKKVSKVVWRFVLTPNQGVGISLPMGAEILSVRELGDEICLWARVNPLALRGSRNIFAIGTGEEVSKELEGMDIEFLGTAVPDGGKKAFHVFEAI